MYLAIKSLGFVLRKNILFKSVFRQLSLNKHNQLVALAEQSQQTETINNGELFHFFFTFIVSIVHRQDTVY